MRARKNQDGSTTWSTKVMRLDPKRGKLAPKAVSLGRNKTAARKLEHELKEQDRRAALGLSGGTRTFLGTFAKLCERAWTHYFAGHRGAQAERSRLNRYGGANIPKPEKNPEAPVRRGRQRGPKPNADGFVSSLGSRPARDLTDADFNAFFLEIGKLVTTRGAVMKGKSINRVRETFAKVFEVAAAFGDWPKHDNPARASIEVEQRDVPCDIWRPEEIGPMLAQIEPYWLGLFVVALTSALRKGELFGLLKADVDIERRVFLVWRSHGVDKTKGGDGTREPVPIHTSALPLVRLWLESPGPYLFPDANGERRKEDTKLEDIARAAMVRAGIIDHWEHLCRRRGCGHRARHPDGEARWCEAPYPGDPSRVCGYKLWPVAKARPIPFRATRHTAATAMLRDDIPLAVVQQILRHKDPKTTIKMYSHLSAGDLVAKIDRLSFPELSFAEVSSFTGTESGDNGGDGVPTEDDQGTEVEPMPELRIASAGAADGLAAYRRQGWEVGDFGLGSDYESGMFLGVLSVEPTGIEPVTYALRTRAFSDPPPVTASHPFGTIGITGAGFVANPSTDSPQFSPRFQGAASYRRQAAKPASPSRSDCIGGTFTSRPPAATVAVAASCPPALLTVRLVAARLHVSTARIYALVEAGLIGHCRIGNNAIRVSEADVAAYIALAQARRSKEGP